MKLIKMELSDYLDALASRSPAPGGGSVSALTGAQGIALGIMVCNLTLGKEKYKEYEAECKQAIVMLTKLFNEMCAAIDNDTDAYNEVSAAYKISKDDPKRDAAIKEAMLIATKVPFETMNIAIKGMREVKELFGKTNINAKSDLEVAILNLKTALCGAWLNVQINLPGISGEDVKEKFANDGKAILKEAEEIEKQLNLSI
ncbi:MAG: cyclodeaminase/cyclohydrolase family protein [Eubacteriales bacterium]